ncbi:MAG TPA: hypothetical protein VGQ65_14440 [Thermoanaerobaculia bacterium]|jgi:hypothetical protein|nr:hypothetical protein [Thermoanaerobaculia bacterium]
MTYYVEKQLAFGPIRFGVSTRQSLDAIGDDVTLSTGANGEFIRRRQDGFFFGDTERVVGPSIPIKPTISQTPFFSSLKPDGTPRGYLFIALMGLGLLIMLLGVSVLMTKGPQGWFEIVFGAVCIALPILMTAQQRRTIREREERERAEREAAERRNQELLSWYTKALDHLLVDRSENGLIALRGERESLDLAYEIWAPAARRVLLRIAFEELSRRGIADSAAISKLLGDAGDAAGLTPEHIHSVKREFFSTILWHLLADDRLGTAQEAEIKTLREGLGLTEDDVEEEMSAVEQFRGLRGVAKGLPRAECPIQLAFQEYCIHQAPLDTGMLFITNRRLVADEKKRTEVAMPKVFEVLVDTDDSSIVIKTDQKKALRLRTRNPIFTAGLIDMASSLDERPKGFA